MRSAVMTPGAAVGHDGAAFHIWWKSFRRIVRFPVLDLSVSLPPAPPPETDPKPSSVDLWRRAVIAGREAKARGDTRGQHDAAEAAKRYALAQLEGRP